jgi:cellulose synthase/poly-beta-1,6-N-acetylglucosamine synthase-like glycosyltransferase
MFFVECTFWICLLLVLHTYLLYPLFLFGACAVVQAARDWRYLRSRQDRRVIGSRPHPLAPVSMVIPAYNEGPRLIEKLENIRQLDYPADRLEIVFISDGSTDETNLLLAQAAPAIKTIRLSTRSGKALALNRGVAEASHEILVFSDAATLLEPDAIHKLVRHFAESGVGVVCGSLRFRATAESRQTEGVYWAYESILRLMEARLGATLTASGALYALRRACYPALSADMLVEDLLIPMNARRLGYRVLYDPEVIGTDYAASSVAGEFTRRVRVATGSFLVIGRLLRIRLGAMTTFAFLSHKVLRWILPFLLIGLIGSSAALSARPFFRWVLLVQVLFYVWAGLGFLLRRRVEGMRYALLAYYLLAIHLAFLVGFVRALTRRRESGWQRVN